MIILSPNLLLFNFKPTINNLAHDIIGVAATLVFLSSIPPHFIYSSTVKQTIPCCLPITEYLTLSLLSLQIKNIFIILSSLSLKINIIYKINRVGGGVSAVPYHTTVRAVRHTAVRCHENPLTVMTAWG
jgi:hypothetical protein